MMRKWGGIRMAVPPLLQSYDNSAVPAIFHV